MALGCESCKECVKMAIAKQEAGQFYGPSDPSETTALAGGLMVEGHENDRGQNGCGHSYLQRNP